MTRATDSCCSFLPQCLRVANEYSNPARSPRTSIMEKCCLCFSFHNESKGIRSPNKLFELSSLFDSAKLSFSKVEEHNSH